MIGGIYDSKATNKTWMFNGNEWEEKADMNVKRIEHACSIVSVTDEKVK